MITTNTANTILKAFFGQTSSFSIASTCYIGLSTTTPKNDGSNFTEPAESAGYARTLLGTSNSSTGWIMDTPANNTIKNTNQIIFFPEATESWGTVTHFGLFSAKTGGTPVFWGALTASVAVPVGYIPIFRAGALSVTLT